MASSREDKKKCIGDLLKAADRYIKAADYTEAMIEVNKALAVEPGNMYALAYNQRIKSALEALRKKEDAARVKKITEEKNAAKSAKAPEPVEPAAVEAPAAELPRTEIPAVENAPEEPHEDTAGSGPHTGLERRGSLHDQAAGGADRTVQGGN